MRNLRKLTLLAVMAVAALALMATSASAQNITVESEVDGNPCPAVSPNNTTIEFPVSTTVTGGCVAHAVNTEGLVILTAHIFGIESTDSQCENEFTARLGANGEGYLTNIRLSGPNCTRRPCGTRAGAPEAWEVHGEEINANSARLEAHFCVENASDGQGRQTCHLFVPFREDPVGSHRYEFGTAAAATPPENVSEISCEGFTGFRAEVTGHWKSELTTLEVIHLI